MEKSKEKRFRRNRAHRRLRRSVAGTEARPRLAVFKSLRFIYAQVIDDQKGVTLVQASSHEPAVRKKLKGSTKDATAAKLVGETVAERAKSKGIDKVVFDRGGYVFHGRVRDLAQGARDKGLQF